MKHKEQKMNGKELTEKLIAYAKVHLHLNETDEVYMRNVLLSKFGLSEPQGGAADDSDVAVMAFPTFLPMN